MTLKEAIIHAKAVAKAKEREAKENRNHGGWAYDDEATKCSACAAEHRQLAEWLKELKERREKDGNNELKSIQGAIRLIKIVRDIDPWTKEIAVEAMQKQIPKKPTVPVDTWLCPSCGEPVEYQQKLGDNVLYHGQHDFCPKCGQAISWEEE